MMMDAAQDTAVMSDVEGVSPDDDPNGIAIQPVTNLCTSTKGTVVPPFLWKEYPKKQLGISDVYVVTISGQECAVGTGAVGEQDVRSCCALAHAHYVSPAIAQVATYLPLVLLLLFFIAIGAFQAWRRKVKKYLDQQPLG